MNKAAQKESSPALRASLVCASFAGPIVACFAIAVLSLGRHFGIATVTIHVWLVPGLTIALPLNGIATLVIIARRASFARVLMWWPLVATAITIVVYLNLLLLR
jgi:hypothetical protein